MAVPMAYKKVGNLAERWADGLDDNEAEMMEGRQVVHWDALLAVQWETFEAARTVAKWVARLVKK